jgi:hypothetical protein
MTKRVFFCAMLVCVAAMSLAAQERSQPGKIKYELYSWREPSGRWTFGLLPAYTSAGTHPNVITHPSNALDGQQKLKRAIAALPRHSEIRWYDHALSTWRDAQELHIIKYPPPEIIADIRNFCRMKGHKLFVEQTRN